MNEDLIQLYETCRRCYVGIDFVELPNPPKRYRILAGGRLEEIK